MALTKNDLQAIRDVMREDIREVVMEALEPVKEQQKVHHRSITNLEHNVMHELKLLNENLPDAISRHETFTSAVAMVDDHDHRIFALEQVANK